MDKQEKLEQLRRLSTISEAVWLKTASTYSALKLQNDDLLRRAAKVSACGQQPVLLYSLAGMDRSLNKWKQLQLKAINQERLHLKIEMATVESLLKEDFGKMNAVATLLRRKD